MKKNMILAIALLTVASWVSADSCGPQESCDCENTSRSYMAVRPHFQSASPELVSAFREDRTDVPKDGYRGAVQAVLFGGRSRKTKDVQRYFMPFCKTELIVDEQNSDLAPGPMDIRATHFNIFTETQDFRSKISIQPQQSVVGLGLNYRQGFWRSEAKNRQWFFSLSAPITHVKNKMELCEQIINGGGGAKLDADINVVANMTEAFRQKEWCYGKITDGKVTTIGSKGCVSQNSCASHSKTGLADIEAKLGIEWIDHDPCHIESYVGILIPTGNKPESKILFEPIVGHGGHFGLFCGGSFGAQIWANQAYDRIVRVEVASHSHYLFKKRQTRSFDLKGKPWSRYMEVYKDKAQAEQADALFMADNLDPKAKNLATPGINELTKPVDVTPGYAHNVTTALVLSCNAGFQGELGYNVYCRRAECVKLACDWKVGPALKAAEGAGQTNRVRNIGGDVLLEEIVEDLADFDNNQIQESDLDLTSAAQPSVLTHTIYGSLGYRWDENKYPMFVSGGSSYEFAQSSNAALERWLVWAKFGISF